MFKNTYTCRFISLWCNLNFVHLDLLFIPQCSVSRSDLRKVWTAYSIFCTHEYKSVHCTRKHVSANCTRKKCKLCVENCHFHKHISQSQGGGLAIWLLRDLYFRGSNLQVTGVVCSGFLCGYCIFFPSPMHKHLPPGPGRWLYCVEPSNLNKLLKFEQLGWGGGEMGAKTFNTARWITKSCMARFSTRVRNIVGTFLKALDSYTK